MNQLPATQPVKGLRPETAWFSVVQAYQVCTRQYERMLSEFDLSIAQFDVMSVIQRLNHQAMPKQIAEHLVVTRGNITGVLQRLQARGLVDTQPHPEDGRARVCGLSTSGRALLAHAQAAATRFIHTQLAPFSDQDMQRTHHLMKQVARHLESMDPVALAQGTDTRNS